MEINFIRGFIYGVVATVIIGYILRRMGKASNTGIVWKSTLAMLEWVFWLIILLIVIVLIVIIALQK